MSSNHKAMAVTLLITIALLLVGCSNTTVTPTTDVKAAALTAAWQTIQASLPKTTPTPPATSAPAATQPVLSSPPPLPTIPQGSPSASTTIQVSGTPRAGQSSTPTTRVMATFVTTGTPASSSTVAIAPTVSSAPPDRGIVSWESPLDYAQFHTNTQFKKTWRLKNIGTTTWNKDYKVRFWAGSAGRMGANDQTIGVEVKPGQEVEITMNFTTPDTGGDYIANWVLSTDQGANFYLFYVAVTISDSPAEGGATSTRGAIVPTATAKQ